MVAVVRPRDLEEFSGDRIVYRSRKYVLVSNWR
jgi:hypothetical protein